MNTQIVAILISEGSKLISQLIRNRPIVLKSASPILPVEVTGRPKPPPVPELEIPDEYPPVSSVNTAQKATETATGCIPCAIGHMGTCSGLLNEAMRFAKSDGMQSNEVIDRVGMCLDELNAMERVDLRPEMIVGLPDWEKALVDEVLIASRATRHALEELDTIDSLEEAAASTQEKRTHTWRSWIKSKMQHLTPEEQRRIQERVAEKLGELE